MVINSGSPIIQNTFGGVSNMDTPSQISPNEMEAAKIADLSGACHYDYNPANRFGQFMNPPTGGQMMQPSIYPQQMMYQQPQYGWNYYSAPQIQYGFGMMQPQPFGTLGYNPGSNPQYQMGNYNGQGFVNNGLGYTPSIQYRDQTYIEPGFSPFGSMMFSSEDASRLDDIIDRQAQEQQEYRQKMGQMYNGMNYNYYGMFNYGYNSYIAAKYQREEYQIIQEAKERQMEFNKMLSRKAHLYLGDEIDDDYIETVYNDRQITIPAVDVESRQKTQWMNTFTVDYRELSKAEYYAAQNMISEEYHNKIISNNDNMTSFLDTAGELYAMGMQYDVERQKRDMGSLYDRDKFRSTFESSLLERQKNNGGTLFPNLMADGQMLSDGTLEIKAPSWLTRASKDSEESYQRNRQKFINSIYNQSRGGNYL